MTLDEMSKARTFAILETSCAIVLGIVALVCIIIYLTNKFSERKAEQKRKVALLAAERAEETERRNIELVERTSERLKEIVALNARFEPSFIRGLRPLEDYVNCATRAQAEHFGEVRLKKRVEAYVSSNIDLVKSHIESANNIKRIYDNYLLEYEGLSPMKFDGELGRIESTLCDQHMLHPECEAVLLIYVRYVSPAGNSTYFGQYRISQAHLQVVLRKVGINASEAELRKRERAKVTPKLRYQVLKRDGFRCVQCGVSAADGAKLHVDHIVPVSRGGKTVMSNLQTLCETCNLGKGTDMPI